MKTFLNRESHGKKMVDKVFKAAVAAKEDKIKFGDQVVDATLGTLYDEEGTFVAFDSVWTPFESIPKVAKGKYAASIQGNPSFQKSVYNWLFGGLETNIPCEIIATPGGAGAVSSTLKNTLNPGEIVIKPSIGWGPYNTMAAEFGLALTSYNMFKDNAFDVEDFKETLSSVMKIQGKVVVIINDPCHNPTGYTLSNNEWDAIIDILNKLSEDGPVVLLHDIAYVDFNNQGNTWKNTFAKFLQLKQNVMVVIAFSTSKTLTAYGARTGAQIAITKDKAQLEAFKDAAIYSARSIWSTVNNGAMELFHLIESNKSLYHTYQKEKNSYVTLLKERSEILVSEANEVGLPIYPYKEGFFVTVKTPNQEAQRDLYQKLQDHHIFTVMVTEGLRIAICSVPKVKLVGLAKRIKALM